jgi:hypothetical protein
VAQKHSGYRVVTDASVYTLRPVITEHRLQVIEEAKPPKRGLGPAGPLEKFIGWVIGAPVGLWLGHWLVSALCGCQ